MMKDGIFWQTTFHSTLLEIFLRDDIFSRAIYNKWG